MNATVAALNSLSIFGPHQAGAYREHSAHALACFGPGVPTRITGFVTGRAKAGASGVLVLTGNAGTGKTALAEAWCQAVGGLLPDEDGLAEVSPDRWAVKDLSGVLASEREEVIALAVALSRGERTGQMLLCANEVMLRDALGLVRPTFLALLDSSLSDGFAEGDGIEATIVNMNRQRWTGSQLWNALLDYLDRPALWDGCDGCVAEGHCPILANANALQQPGPRQALRRLIQFASGSTVATLRELLGIVSVGITGGLTCADVKGATEPFDASFGYFNLVLGSSLDPDRIERSPLLQAMRECDLGSVADLEVDGWLRDTGGAPDAVRQLGDPQGEDPHSMVQTAIGRMTFARLGEILTVSDDPEAVGKCLQDLLEGRRFLSLWRRRIFFEAAEEVGGAVAGFARLTRATHFGELLEVAGDLGEGRSPSESLSGLVKGLNYLASGFHEYLGKLIVPDPSSLIARNPGAFREPDPSIVHSELHVADLGLAAEDGERLREVLDTDGVRAVLRASRADGNAVELLLTPRLYQAVMEASAFRSPVGSDIPEMAELERFYAELCRGVPTSGLRVVDPMTKGIVEIALPDLG
jgi:hypothetical protein